MERRFFLEAFRNVGFNDNKPSKEGIVLNNSLYKDKIGDLVILIGPNNSGKSNVLDALRCFSQFSMSNRDVTDLFMEPEMRKPQLTFCSRNEEEEYSCRLYENNEVGYLWPKKDSKAKKSLLSYFHDKEDFLEQTKSIQNINRYMGFTVLDKMYANIEISKESDERIDEIINDIVSSLINHIQDIQIRGVYNHYVAVISKLSKTYYYIFQEKIGTSESKKENDYYLINEDYSSKYEMKFIPKIIDYQEKIITNKNLITTYHDFKNNSFYTALFNVINFDKESLVNAYNVYKEQNNKGVLTQIERKINKQLKKIGDQFSELYYLEDEKYTFEIRLESAEISFSIFRGTQALSLDNQSTGFKWFFNLFFYIFASNDWDAGDIIIMDEPATNLHVRGQEELRAFLKDFAIKHGITIVIATHSPFLIDMDYLDELRIISNKENICHIDNDFSAINIDDPDSLLPVKESLTVRNSVLVDPDKQVVFVEGITDYNYLVGMKKVLGIDDLIFLPVKGIGKTKEQQIEISQRLLKIRKNNSVLLVDGDKAGKEMKKLNGEESELKVVCLQEVNEKFGEIETLFDPEDLKKFNIINEKGKFVKHNSTSSIIKKELIKDHDSVSEVTKNNFKELFDYLLDN